MLCWQNDNVKYELSFCFESEMNIQQKKKKKKNNGFKNSKGYSITCLSENKVKNVLIEQELWVSGLPQNIILSFIIL